MRLSGHWEAGQRVEAGWALGVRSEGGGWVGIGELVRGWRLSGHWEQVRGWRLVGTGEWVGVVAWAVVASRSPAVRWERCEDRRPHSVTAFHKAK